MRIRLRDLIILFLILTLAGNYVYYLFRNIYEEETKIDKNLYEIISDEPNALMRIRETNHWQNSENKYILQNLISPKTPQLYLNLFSDLPVKNLLIGFYPYGTICYLETSYEKAEELRLKLESYLNTYPPKVITTKGIKIYYFADAYNKFAGCFYYKGFWVSSYNKKLLDEAASNILAATSNHVQQIIPKTHSRFNLLIPTNKLIRTQEGLDFFANINNKEWISSDIYLNNKTMSFVFNLPKIEEDKDSVSIQISDSLQYNFSHYLRIPADSLHSDYQLDNNGLFVSLNYPIQ